MVAGIVGAIARSIIAASVDQNASAGAMTGRGYYNWVITAVACFMPALLFVFFIGGVSAALQGQERAWLFTAFGLGGSLGLGALVAHQIFRREAIWDETGVMFRWLNGEARLTWSEIEKVEIRQLSRGHARIRFRDGRTFGISAQFTGCNALLQQLGRHGVPFHKWGTSTPISAK